MVILERIGKRIKIVSHFASEIRIAKDALKIWHPDAFSITSYQNKTWDGYVRFYNSVNNTFPFGLCDLVIAAFAKHEIDWVPMNFVQEPTAWIQFSEMLQPEERYYQREAIMQFMKYRYGVIKVPTRGGKTIIASEILRLTTQILPESRVLFLTESSDVLNQNAPEIAKFLGETVGRIQGECFKPRRVTAAMVQTIQARLKNNSKLCIQWLQTIDFIVIDEVHEFLSPERIKLINSMQNVQYILGLSATPFKKSKKIASLELQGSIGGILYEIEEKTLQDLGVLAENKVVLVVFEHNAVSNDLSYVEMLKTIIHSGDRNKVILLIMQVMQEQNKKTLVMFNSIPHGKNIESSTGVEFINGSDDSDTRLQAKINLLSKTNMLLVSEIWRKGITLPEVEVFVNTSVGKEDTSIIQKRGRILGATSTKKKSLAIDILDIEDKYFSEHSMARLKTYQEQVGDNNIIVVYYGENFAADLLKIVLEHL